MYEFKVNITRSYCETTFPGAFSISYRLTKIYHICLSLVSMIAICYFIIYYKKYLIFHFNIKILFYIQFASCFTHATVLATFQSHHFLKAVLAKHPCDVILSPTLFAFFHIPLIFSMICIEISQFLMTVERTIACFKVLGYEKTNYTLGLVLTVFSLLLPLIICTFMYFGDNFDYPQMSALSTSPNSSTKINFLFICGNILNIFILVHSIALYKLNQKNGKRTLPSNTLSTRYQLNENINSSRVLWLLSAAQLLIFLFYGISMYLLRIFLTGTRSAGWQAVTEFLYTPPIYCSMMPVLCISIMKGAQKTRDSKMHCLLTMRSTGAEGWNNYQMVLQKQWQ